MKPQHKHLSEFKSLTGKTAILIEELKISELYERMRAKFKTFYLLKDGFLLDQDGNHTPTRTPQEMASFLSLRRVFGARLLEN